MSDEPSRSRRLYSEYWRAELNRAADIVCDVIRNSDRVTDRVTGIPRLCDTAAMLDLDPRTVTFDVIMALRLSGMDPEGFSAEPGTAWFVIATMAMRKGFNP